MFSELQILLISGSCMVLSATCTYAAYKFRKLAQAEKIATDLINHNDQLDNTISNLINEINYEKIVLNQLQVEQVKVNSAAVSLHYSIEDSKINTRNTSIATNYNTFFYRADNINQALGLTILSQVELAETSISMADEVIVEINTAQAQLLKDQSDVEQLISYYSALISKKQ